MIPKFTIARIKEEARIEEVVGEFVSLKKRGSSLLGLCPFHNEKTPSFNVSVSKGIYKCFGCGKAGDSVSFLMETQQLGYVDALKYLAKKYNIEIIEEFVSDETKKEEEEKHSQQESILIANAYAQKFFTDILLHSEEGGIGLSYFKERGFSTQMIEKFQLGFSPEKGNALTETALSNGFQLDILKKAGLTSSKENSKYDFFRNRVMFPIHNLTGKVIAFGGRIMVKDEKAPKYVNTPESDVYIKSKILYGIYFARNEIRKQDECLLVEGYTDVISLFQSGIENIVASSGTALTIDQIKLVKRITPNITVLYDGDAAGIKAALRGTDMILEEGMNVRVVILPDQEDPDSYVRKVGASEFTKFIKENRKDLISFKAKLFAEEAKKDPIKKAELIRDIVQSVAKIPDLIQRSVYVKECATQMDIQEQIIITEVNKIRRQKIKEEKHEDIAPQTEIEDQQKLQELHKEQLQESVNHNLEFVEKDIIRLLIESGTWEIELDKDTTETTTQFILDDLEGVEFESKYKRLFEYIKSEFLHGNIHDASYYTKNDDPEFASLSIDLLTSPHELSEGWWKRHEIAVPDKHLTLSKDILSATMRLKQLKNLEQIKKIEDLLRVEKEDDKIIRLMTMHKKAMEQKKEFAKVTGTVIYRPS